MRRRSIGVLFSVLLVITWSCSGDTPVAVSFRPAEPSADHRLAIRYDPAVSGSPLRRSQSVHFRFTLVGPYGELYTNALPMERKGPEWRVRLKPGEFLRPSPVVMLCSFVDAEDPEVCDSNGGDPWVLRFFEEGKPVRGAEYQLYRLCSSEIRLPQHLGIPTDEGRGLRGLDAERAAHPDYLPARTAHWQSELAAAGGDSILLDSLTGAIRSELDGVFDVTLRADEPDTTVAPLLALYQEIGAVSRAESLLAEVRARFPHSRFAARCEFDWAYAPDDLEPARSRLEEFLRSYPGFPEAKKARDFLFMIYDNVMKTPDEAAALVRTGEQIDRDHLKRYARILIKKGDLEGAEAVVRRCLQEAESDAWTGSGLATPMEWHREHEEELRSDRVLLAWILGERKSYDEAAALLESIVETMARAGDRIGLANLAEYQDSLGRGTEALLTYDRLGESVRPKDETVEAWRAVYVKVHGNDGGFADRLAMLEVKRLANQRARLERHVLDWPVPDVTMLDLDGSPRPLAAFRGKVVLLDFWATWCGPCLASLPNVEKVYRSLATSEEVAVIALDTWERGACEERRAAIEEKWTELGLSLPVYLDMETCDDEKSRAAELFRVPAIPTSFVIDRHGRILFRGGGIFDESDVEDLRLKLEFALSRGGPPAL